MTPPDQPTPAPSPAPSSAEVEAAREAIDFALASLFLHRGNRDEKWRACFDYLHAERDRLQLLKQEYEHGK